MTLSGSDVKVIRLLMVIMSLLSLLSFPTNSVFAGAPPCLWSPEGMCQCPPGICPLPPGRCSCYNNETVGGGVVVPIDKLGLVAPYIGLASTIIGATVATAISVKRVKRRKEKQ